MAFVGNLLWFVFGGGFFAWLVWLLVAGFFAITIIGIPFAKAAFRISVFSAFPFGKELIDGRLVGKERITGTGFVNFLWCALAGLWLSIIHALAGLGYCITLIGIPFGLAHFKLAQVSFAPLGKVIVSPEVAQAARARAAHMQLDKALSGKDEADAGKTFTRQTPSQPRAASSSEEAQDASVPPPRDPVAEILADQQLKQLLEEMPIEKLQAIIDARALRAAR